MSPRTKNNLNTAMEAAALAFAKYSRFAARARTEQDWELAREFQQTADSERCEHFASETDLEGFVHESADNLRDTIAAETKQIEFCKRFAREAREDGDLAVASTFERVSRDKDRRCERFQHILERIGVNSDGQLVGS